MNDFEHDLAGLPLRRIPPAWRSTILPPPAGIASTGQGRFGPLFWLNFQRLAFASVWILAAILYLETPKDADSSAPIQRAQLVEHRRALQSLLADHPSLPGLPPPRSPAPQTLISRQRGARLV
jgi:hypothetical protein